MESSQMCTSLWIIVFLTVFARHAECQGTFNFPDNPQPTPADSSDVLPGLEGVYQRISGNINF